jgi:ribonucleoside-diphosphate reductase alpha chain
VRFVAEELKAVFDPQGGAWIDGRYVPSLQAAIGGIIESHLGHYAAGAREEAVTAALAPPSQSPAGTAARAPGFGDDGAVTRAGGDATAGDPWHGRALCPRCNEASLVRKDGCFSCQNCGFSRCD